MSLFRRGPKVDRTQPLPPPPGLKWVVSKSVFTGQPYALGLFPLDAEVDEWGIYKRPHPGNVNFAKGAPIPHHAVANAMFTHAHEVRGASKRVLGKMAARAAGDARFANLRNTIR